MSAIWRDEPLLPIARGHRRLEVEYRPDPDRQDGLSHAASISVSGAYRQFYGWTGLSAFGGCDEQIKHCGFTRLEHRKRLVSAHVPAETIDGCGDERR